MRMRLGRLVTLGVMASALVCGGIAVSAAPLGASQSAVQPVVSAATIAATASPVATPTPEPTTTPVPALVPTITVAAVGDMCFASAPGRLVASRGPKAPFTQVASLLRAADVAVGNLECALSRRGSAVPGKAYTFRGDPRVVDGLKWAGLDLLAMGNNHARDYGPTALKDTVTCLDGAKLAHAGAGANWAAAVKPAIIKVNGARVAYLSFSQIGPSSFRATRSGAGTAYTLDLATVKNAIAAAHKKADYVFVSFHWGVERQYTPTSTQVRFGRTAIDAGADLVLSHHPHVIEGVEYYRGKLIAYSLGNFVFSPGSTAGHDTLVLNVCLTQKKVLSASAKPVIIDVSGRPTLATGSNAARILNRIVSTSRARGTNAYTSGGMARLRSR